MARRKIFNFGNDKKIVKRPSNPEVIVNNDEPQVKHNMRKLEPRLWKQNNQELANSCILKDKTPRTSNSTNSRNLNDTAESHESQQQQQQQQQTSCESSHRITQSYREETKQPRKMEEQQQQNNALKKQDKGGSILDLADGTSSPIKTHCKKGESKGGMTGLNIQPWVDIQEGLSSSDQQPIDAVSKVLSSSSDIVTMMESADKSKADARTLLKECEEQLAQLTAERHGTNMKVITLETAKVEVESLLMQAEQKIVLLQSSNEASVARVSELESKKAIAEREVRESQVKLILMSIEVEASGLKIQELEASKTEAKRRLQEAEEQVVWLQNENETTVKEYMSLELSKADFECELMNAQRRADFLQDEKDTLTTRLKQIEKDMKAKDERLMAAESKNKKVVKELKSAQEEVKSLRLDKDASDMRIKSIELEMKKFQRQLEDTQNEVQTELGVSLSNRRHDSSEESNNPNLEQQQQIAISKLSQTTNQNKPLDSEVSQMENEFKTFESLKSALELRAKESEETINILRQQMEASESRLRETQSEKAELELLLQEAKSKGESAATRMQELLDQTKSLLEERKILSAQKKQIETAKSETQSKLIHAERRIVLLETEKESALSNFEKLKSKKVEIERKFEDAQEHVSLLREETVALSRKLTQVKTSHAETEGKLEEGSVTSANIAKQKAQLERQLKTSEEQLKSLRVELEAKALEAKEVEKEKDGIDLLLGEVLKKNADLGIKLNAAEEKLRSRSLWNTNSDSRKRSTTDESNTEEAGNTSIFQWAKSSLLPSPQGGEGRSDLKKASSLDDLSSAVKVTQLKAENDDLNSEKVTLTSQVDSLQRENDSLSQRVLDSQAEKDRLQHELKEFEQAIALLKKVEGRFVEEQKETSMLRTERQKLLASIEETKERLNEVDCQKNSVVSKLAKSTEELRKVRMDLTAAKNAMKHSHENVEELKFEKLDLLTRLTNLETKNTTILGRLQVSEEDAIRLRGEQIASTKLIGELEKDKENIKGQLDAVEERFDTVKSEKESLATRFEKLDELVNRAEVEKNTLRTKLDDSETMLQKALRELNETKDSLAAKDSDVQQLQATFNNLTTLFHEVLRRTEKQVSRLKKRASHLKEKYKRLEIESSEASEHVISKLRIQNDRASKVMRGLSKELTSVTAREVDVSKQCTALQLDVEKLEEKNKSLQDEYNALESQSTLEKEVVAEKLSALSQALRELKKEQELRRLASSSTDNHIQGSEIVQHADSTEQSESMDAILITQDEHFRKAVQFAPYLFKTEVAQYLIRRPYNLEDSDIFTRSGFSTSNDYGTRGNVKFPVSIEVAAKIVHDGSTLFLAGSSNVHHMKSDGSVNDYSSVDLLDHPMGWITYVTRGGEEEYYSLDEVLEEAKMHRERYCKSIISAATNAEKGLMRLAHNSKSEVLSKFIYAVATAPGSDLQLLPTDKPESVFIITAACVSALSAALTLWN